MAKKSGSTVIRPKGGGGKTKGPTISKTSAAGAAPKPGTMPSPHPGNKAYPGHGPGTSAGVGKR